MTVKTFLQQNVEVAFFRAIIAGRNIGVSSMSSIIFGEVVECYDRVDAKEMSVAIGVSKAHRGGGPIEESKATGRAVAEALPLAKAFFRKLYQADCR